MDHVRKRFWDQLVYAGEDSYECHNCGCMVWDAGKHIEWHVTMLDLAKLATRLPDAWDEGFNSGHYVEGEKQECDCRENPYRDGGGVE